MILTVSNPFAASKKKIRQKKKARKLEDFPERKPRAKTAGAPDSSRRQLAPVSTRSHLNLSDLGMMQPNINQSSLSVTSGASSARTQTSQMVLDMIAKDEEK
jgi:hypothetical protein